MMRLMSIPMVWVLPCIAFWLVLTSLATANDLNNAFQQGKDTAAGGAAATNTINTNKATETVPGYNTNPKESTLYNDGKRDLQGDGFGKQANCQSANTSGFNGQECNAINFLGGGTPNYPISKNDSLFNLSKGVTKNTRDGLAGLGTGNNTGGCTKVTVKNPDLQKVEHCEEWLKTEEKRCPVGRIVTVDRDSNYQCDVTTATKRSYECNKRLTVTCQTPSDGCDPNGVSVGGAAGDMRWDRFTSGGNLYLTFGTVGNDYWGWGVHDRVGTITIDKISDVSMFRLERAWFDDWLWVQINGHTVFVGPYGGDRLDVRSDCTESPDFGTYCTESVYYTDSSNGPFELRTSWDRWINIDIRPYLRQGTNTIWTRTVVGGRGESAIRFITRQYCPPVCHDSWSDGCTGYYR